MLDDKLLANVGQANLTGATLERSFLSLIIFLIEFCGESDCLQSKGEKIDGKNIFDRLRPSALAMNRETVD